MINLPIEITGGNEFSPPSPFIGKVEQNFQSTP